METPAPAVPAENTAQNTASTDVNADVKKDQNVPADKDAVPVQAESKKYKLKFGKSEKEVDEKTLLAMAQKGWAADEKFQGASKKEKAIAALIEKLENDPDAIFKHIGKDPIEVYKKRLAAELQRKVMSPEQRELEDARIKLKEYEELEKKRKEQEHADKLDKLTKHYEQEYDKQMSDAIVAAGLPKTPKTIKRAAELAYRNLEMGLDLPWPTIMEMVRDEYQSDIRDLFGSASSDKLIELLGEDVTKGITQASLKKRVIDPEPITEQTRKAARSPVKTEIVSEETWDEKVKKWKQS